MRSRLSRLATSFLLAIVIVSMYGSRESLPYLAAFMVIIVVTELYRYRKERARTEDVTRASRSHGRPIDAEDPQRALAPLLGFPLFKRLARPPVLAWLAGGKPRCANMWRRVVDGVEVISFDYLEPGEGGERGQTVAAVRVPGRALPQFVLGRGRPSRPVGPDETAIRTLFDRPVLDYLDLPENRDVAVEAGGEWVIVYRSAQRIEPARLDVFIKEARTLVRLLTENS